MAGAVNRLLDVELDCQRHDRMRMARADLTPVVLTIGYDTFTDEDLARVNCDDVVAAQKLSRALARLPIVDTRHVFKCLSPEALPLPRGSGAAMLAVLGAAFELRGVGGTRPLRTWVYRHAPHLKEHRRA